MLYDTTRPLKRFITGTAIVQTSSGTYTCINMQEHAETCKNMQKHAVFVPEKNDSDDLIGRLLVHGRLR